MLFGDERWGEGKGWWGQKGGQSGLLFSDVIAALICNAQRLVSCKFGAARRRHIELLGAFKGLGAGGFIYFKRLLLLDRPSLFMFIIAPAPQWPRVGRRIPSSCARRNLMGPVLRRAMKVPINTPLDSGALRWYFMLYLADNKIFLIKNEGWVDRRKEGVVNKIYDFLNFHPPLEYRWVLRFFFSPDVRTYIRCQSYMLKKRHYFHHF